MHTLPYKKIFLVLIFGAMIILMDILTGMTGFSLLSLQRDGRYHKIGYTLDKCKEDIVIVGSSHAESNFCPHSISKVLRKSCWNAGRGGQGILYWYMMYKTMIHRHAPKIIILNIEPNALEYSANQLIPRANLLKPFAKNHRFIKEGLSAGNKIEEWKLSSNLYCYNSTLVYFLRPFFQKGKDGKPEDLGWKPKDGQINITEVKKQKEIVNSYKPVQHNMIRMLQEMMVLAAKHHILLVVVYSPDFFPYTRATTTMQTTNSLASKYNFPVLDYTKDTNFIGKPHLFYDIQHLNREGAILFSRDIAEKVKVIMLSTQSNIQ